MFAKPSLIAAGLALGLAGLMPSAAQAHRRWLLPTMTSYSGEKAEVSVDAAASNELFIFEHRPLGLEDLTITGPDGQPVQPEIVGTGKLRSVFDFEMDKQGTYRLAIASDRQMGSYMLGGERKRFRGGADQVPAGATEVQIANNAQRVETFVTLGAPDDTALQPSNSGLEMIPITHPNDLVAGEPAEMRFLIDGKPAAGLELEFIEGGTRYRDKAGIQTLTTDAEGKVTLNAPEAGMYYIEASTGDNNRRASYTAVIEFLPL